MLNLFGFRNDILNVERVNEAWFSPIRSIQVNIEKWKKPTNLFYFGASLYEDLYRTQQFGNITLWWYV
jgi:hypothetical protein